ncbi:hypothetical protein ABZ446_28455 [Streptomyces sp. NPDC005813]|uniref:hypothetical protein n=1 Tax=Streptomyces sp. NPDC005813 TaxID=3155592 RepID=UPI0033CB443F
MTTLEERLQDVQRHIDYDDRADIPRDVYTVLEALVGDVQALREGLQNLRELSAMRPTSSAGVSRADALTLAREHVEAMGTNSRGFQDGVKLSDKVQAMECFARFLMGESE